MVPGRLPTPAWGPVPRLDAATGSMARAPQAGSINNVVDITNYVLHEVGQPLHAFDAAKIKGDKVIVKTQPEGTKFVTLDGVERTLTERDLMII